MKMTQAISLDLCRWELRAPVQAKQGDNATRFLCVTLTANGVPYMPPEGATAGLRCVKPDGCSCDNPAVINDDGSITAELTEQVLAVPGRVWADLYLEGSAGERLATTNFQIQVEPIPLGAGITSTSEFLSLVHLVERGEELVADLADEYKGVDAMREQIINLTEQCTSLREDVNQHTQALTEHTQTLEDHYRDIDTLQQEIAAGKQQLTEQSATLEELIADLTDEQKGVDAMRKQIINLTEQCTSLRSDLTNHGQIQLNQQKEMTSHRETINEILAEQAEMKQTISALDEHAQTLESHETTLTEHGQAIEALQTSMESTAQQAGEVLNSHEQRITELEQGGDCALPEVTEEDNDKILQVVNGVWTVVTVADSAVATYVDDYINEALGGDY